MSDTSQGMARALSAEVMLPTQTFMSWIGSVEWYKKIICVITWIFQIYHTRKKYGIEDSRISEMCSEYHEPTT